MIGRKLRLARTRAGLSLRQLEEKLDNLVSAQAIGKYERDEMTPSSRVLIALADALDVSESYLVGQGDLDLENVEFRKRKITNAREVAQVTAAVTDLLERYLGIEEILQAASLEWDRPREAPFPVVEIAGAEYAAEKTRDHWALGTNPIPSPGYFRSRGAEEQGSGGPGTGLAEFLEERGIKVLSLALPQSVSGLTCLVRRRQSQSVPVIVVNAGHTGERQRFTIAHELGHLLMAVNNDVDEEKASNRFAGAFLMPADTVWAEIGKRRQSLSLPELFSLKVLFGMSVQAITYRLKDLSIISHATYQQLFKLFSREGWRRPPFDEPFPIRKEEPTRFRRLCFWALSENAISEAKAAELLGISVHDLERQMEEPSTVVS